MSYPILYAAGTHGDFNHLGLGVLKDVIRCVVIEERNGIFELEMTYPITGIHCEALKNDRLIKADAGHELKDQLFRIERIERVGKGMVEVYARHVSYEAKGLVLDSEVLIENQTAEGALQLWSRAILDTHPFRILPSDIVERRSTRFDIRHQPNARTALGGTTGSILETWGGEYLFDNYQISLRRRRGREAHTMISYGRNLVDLNQEENIANTFTSLYPYAIFREGDTEHIVTVSGTPVLDSVHAGAYAHRRVLPVDFSREFERNTRPTSDRLRALGEAYLLQHEIGVPQVSISLSFVDLTKVLNGSQVTNERFNLCDVVPVRFEKLGIDTTARVVRVEWNVLLDQYDEISMGEIRTTLGETMRQVDRNLNAVSQETGSALTAANGRNTIFFGPDEPLAPRVGDLWYRPDGAHTQMLMWDGTAWKFILSTADNEALRKRIDEAEAQAERELERVNEQMDEANRRFDAIEPLLNITDPATGAQTTVAAMAKGLQSAVFDTRGESRITQLSNDINLRVRAGDVINQINVSSEGVLIAGRRIHLTGQTFIDNAVIRSAHIHSLEANKITTGTLNAGNLRVINLDAASIATGTLNSDRIAARSITASHMTLSDHSNLVQVNPQIASTLSLDGSRQTATTGAVPDIRSTVSSWARVTLAVFRDRNVAMNGTQYQLRADFRSSIAQNLNLIFRVHYRSGTHTQTRVTVAGGGLGVNSWTNRTTNVVLANFDPSREFDRLVVQVEGDSSSQSRVDMRHIRLIRRHGAELLVDGAVRAHHIEANTISAAHLRADAITAGMITTGFMHGNRIEAGTLHANRIQADTLSAGMITAGTMSAARIGSGTITVGYNSSSSNGNTFTRITSGVIEMQQDRGYRARYSVGGLTLSSLNNTNSINTGRMRLHLHPSGLYFVNGNRAMDEPLQTSLNGNHVGNYINMNQDAAGNNYAMRLFGHLTMVGHAGSGRQLFSSGGGDIQITGLGNFISPRNVQITSSRALKEDIEPVVVPASSMMKPLKLRRIGLDVINGLKVVTYRFKKLKKDPETHDERGYNEKENRPLEIGVIAEDSPDVASVAGEVPGVDTGKVMWHSVIAIQQLTQKIESLEKELEEMKNGNEHK